MLLKRGSFVSSVVGNFLASHGSAPTSSCLSSSSPLRQKVIKRTRYGGTVGADWAKAIEGGAPHKYTLLTDRALFRIYGEDVIPFLQGLTTNDMTRLEDPCISSLYTLFLNTQGRVLFDAIIFECGGPGVASWTNSTPGYLLDVHKDAAQRIIDIFMKYKLRKKVDVINCTEELSLYATFPCFPETSQLDGIQIQAKDVFRLTGTNTHAPENDMAQAEAADPRLQLLGTRFVLPTGEDPTLWACEYPAAPGGLSDYQRTRHIFGVPEGPEEIIPEKALPLEVNGDYLNGISFHKGCYIGQELTARTHHTGVVRKRVMPIYAPDRLLAQHAKLNDKIVNEKGKSVGTIRGLSAGNFGLGLLRVDEVLPAHSAADSSTETAAESTPPEITLENKDTVRVQTWKPEWWSQGDLDGAIRGFQSSSPSGP